MEFYGIDFMYQHLRSGNKNLYAHVSQLREDTVLLRINDKALYPLSAPSINLYLTEQQLIELKNSLLSSYEKWRREKYDK